MRQDFTYIALNTSNFDTFKSFLSLDSVFVHSLAKCATYDGRGNTKGKKSSREEGKRARYRKASPRRRAIYRRGRRTKTVGRARMTIAPVTTN